MNNVRVPRTPSFVVGSLCCCCSGTGVLSKYKNDENASVICTPVLPLPLLWGGQ